MAAAGTWKDGPEVATDVPSLCPTVSESQERYSRPSDRSPSQFSLESQVSIGTSTRFPHSDQEPS